MYTIYWFGKATYIHTYIHTYNMYIQQFIVYIELSELLIYIIYNIVQNILHLLWILFTVSHTIAGFYTVYPLYQMGFIYQRRSSNKPMRHRTLIITPAILPAIPIGLLVSNCRIITVRQVCEQLQCSVFHLYTSVQPGSYCINVKYTSIALAIPPSIEPGYN